MATNDPPPGVTVLVPQAGLPMRDECRLGSLVDGRGNDESPPFRLGDGKLNDVSDHIDPGDRPIRERPEASFAGAVHHASFRHHEIRRNAAVTIGALPQRVIRITTDLWS